ncbi:MAG TPA: heparan-alpha-glucosaminide N-acetyltransferase domain-containing protein [Longimicrobium sp.]|nr:heparan-alpha-glucosaminide N-acetyltransferase domain-containing protein [Longimicrobium sp.]
MDAHVAAEPSAGAIPAVPVAARPRLDSVDLLRGLVMVIMLLDHTRDFVHASALRFDPLDLSQTSPELFLTRWITHFCAPIFVFLAGTGAYLQLARGRPKAELSRFLWTRGVWLIVLELTLVRAGLAFNLDYASFLGAPQVIWAIGWSMIVLAALIHLPLRWVAAFGVVVVALGNLLDGVAVSGWRGPGTPPPDLWASIYMVLHQPGPIPLQADGSPMVFILYPLIPWIGVMAAGYALGWVYTLDAARRQRILVRLGLGLVAAFIAIRAINIYGDPREWSAQRNALYTALSFVNTTKYPASLLFVLMTIGPALLLLAWFERTRRGPLSRAVVTLGRVPMFYYLLQWPVAKGLAILVSLAAGKEVAHYFLDPIGSAGAAPPDHGFSLATTYAVWIAGLLILYPLCRWFAAVKARRRDWWLSYL